MVSRPVALLARWFEPPPPATSRLQLVLRSLPHVGAMLVALLFAWRITAPVRNARAPTLPADSAPGVRFGLPEQVRKGIFEEMATAEIEARRVGVGGFNGHAWSMEDQRASLERYAAHAVADRRRISLTQVYLVLDEGIRARWPGPDGKPLAPVTPPLDPRRQ